MASIRTRKETGRLFLDFRYRGVRCREQTALKDTAANRKRLKALAGEIEAAMLLGTFRYEQYFPGSPNSRQFQREEQAAPGIQAPEDGPRTVPTLEQFAQTWFEENRVRWKASMERTVVINLNAHIRPALGREPVDTLDRAQILAFRAGLAERRRGNGKGRLSNDRINHIMTILNQIMAEAAHRWGFEDPCAGIRRLPTRLPDVHPLSLDQVRTFLANVRPDLYHYYLIRFFTGLRTAEVDGLKWRYVDLERGLVLVRETLVDGKPEIPKTQGSVRDVQISRFVQQAFREQWRVTGHRSDYVFCTPEGRPLNHRNLTRRVWHPTLRYLGYDRRRPYETRHTAATLWLAAGENPEWIARQLGHTSTEMLFKRYSRFVPNLTRQDGSAFERLLSDHGLKEDDTNE